MICVKAVNPRFFRNRLRMFSFIDARELGAVIGRFIDLNMVDMSREGGRRVHWSAGCRAVRVTCRVHHVDMMDVSLAAVLRVVSKT